MLYSLVSTGAALYGASLSRQFKTKDIRVTDTLVHEVQASYFASTPGSRTINSHIFPRNSKYGTKKTLTFNKRKEDFSLWLDYKSEAATYAYFYFAFPCGLQLNTGVVASLVKFFRHRFQVWQKHLPTSRRAVQLIQ